ncbi:hypothetical protein O9929_15250 [Vibrio lentus]|nr:hypothetical protein [Vibrio lentus]
MKPSTFQVDGRVIGSGKINIETIMVDAIFVDPDFAGKRRSEAVFRFAGRILRFNTTCP